MPKHREDAVDTMTLDQKLDLLITLAGDDHERAGGKERTLPPRLRHTKDVGALRPLNIRDLRVPGKGRCRCCAS